MSHGFPDYGVAAPSEYIYPITTRFDYAVKQGLVTPHDGKGDIYWGDDFELGLGKWETSGDAAGNFGTITMDRARSGTSAVKLSVTDAAGGQAVLKTTIEPPTLTRLGIELHFTIPLDTRRITLYYDYNSGTTRYRAEIYWSDTPLLRLRDHTLGNTPIDATKELTDFAPTYFNTLKLVIDTATKKYVRLHAAGSDYDISAYDIPHAAYAKPASIHIEWYYVRTNAEAEPSYVDDVILTTNEP